MQRFESVLYAASCTTTRSVKVKAATTPENVELIIFKGLGEIVASPLSPRRALS